MTDPRPGLSEWLRSHWPPAMVWGISRLKPLTRAFAWRFGWDEYCSATLLATVKAWDRHDPSAGAFGTFMPFVVRSELKDQLKAASRLRRLEPPCVPLTDDLRPAPPAADSDDRDEVAFLTAARPDLAPLFAAVMDADTVADAAARLGLSKQAVHQRLSRLGRSYETMRPPGGRW